MSNFFLDSVKSDELENLNDTNDLTRMAYQNKSNDIPIRNNSIIDRNESNSFINHKESFETNNKRINSLNDEIRDLKFDSIKLATIPQQIGVKKTKILGVLLLLIFLGLNVFKEEIITIYLYKEIIMTFILMLFILFSTKYRNTYYTSFWVEALPIFWLILMLL